MEFNRKRSSYERQPRRESAVGVVVRMHGCEKQCDFDKNEQDYKSSEDLPGNKRVFKE